MKAVQRTLSALSVVFFGLLGFFWVMMGLAGVIAQTGGVWSIIVGTAFLAFGSLNIVAAVAFVRKRRWGRIILLLFSAVNAVWWSVIGLVPFLLDFLRLSPILPEEAETPIGPFAVFALISIFFLIFLLIFGREK